ADGDNRSLQQQAHVLDETCLSTARRAGEHHRKFLAEGLLELPGFAAIGEIGVCGYRFLRLVLVMRPRVPCEHGPIRGGVLRCVGCAETAEGRTLRAADRPVWVRCRRSKWIR